MLLTPQKTVPLPVPAFGPRKQASGAVNGGLARPALVREFRPLMEAGDQDRTQLEASRVLSILSGKWTCELLWLLCDRTFRLSQLQRRLPRASKKVLVEELRKLERCGLLTRTDFSDRYNRHVEYSLGDDIRPGIRMLLETLAHSGVFFASQSAVD